MLSQVSWPQFWLFIAVAITTYYLFVLLVYFRTESIAVLRGGIGKKTNSATTRSFQNAESVIGNFENEKLKRSFNTQETSNVFEENSNKVTSSSEDFYENINQSLLEDAHLSEDFIARVNAGLEDEPLELDEETQPEENYLNDDSGIDAEDFFKLIAEGLESLPIEIQVQIANNEIYRELLVNQIEVDKSDRA